jgi:predicted sugar kinase
MALQDCNHEALRQTGAERPLAPEDQAVLDLFAENGAFAWGRSPTGIALYGLVQGQRQASDMKKRLLALKGHFAGTTMATGIDNAGATTKLREAKQAAQGRASAVTTG